MTATQYIEKLLQDNWEADITGRDHSVPQPQILRESPESLRRMDLSTSDVALLRDGGVTDIEPRSWGWSEERNVSRVTIDLRTSGESGSVPGRERLWGYRDENNDAERYGGLTGETKRIMDAVRTGDKEFDIVRVPEQNDLSSQMGGQIWRATTEVILDTRASSIDPSP